VKRIAVIVCALAALAGWCWLLPPFHIVSLRQARQQEQSAAFDTTAFARNFWDHKLLPAADQATDLGELLATLAADPAAARKKFGRAPGFTTQTYFFVKGSGRVIAVEKGAVRVTPDGDGHPPTVELSTGLLFGNAVRDASGLLNASDFPNSQDFNAISSELNHIVETDVVPDLRRQAAAGRAIQFAGCVELEEETNPDTLTVVPVKVNWP
jgi:predicted lipoprotein